MSQVYLFPTKNHGEKVAVGGEGCGVGAKDLCQSQGVDLMYFLPL